MSLVTELLILHTPEVTFLIGVYIVSRTRTSRVIIEQTEIVPHTEPTPRMIQRKRITPPKHIYIRIKCNVLRNLEDEPIHIEKARANSGMGFCRAQLRFNVCHFKVQFERKMPPVPPIRPTFQNIDWDVGINRPESGDSQDDWQIEIVVSCTIRGQPE
jgi:hypothetical protein